MFSREEGANSILDNMNADPDQNYFRNCNWSSNYIAPDALEKHIKLDGRCEDLGLSVLHINCRSMVRIGPQL